MIWLFFFLAHFLLRETLLSLGTRGKTLVLSQCADMRPFLSEEQMGSWVRKWWGSGSREGREGRVNRDYYLKKDRKTVSSRIEKV